MTPWILEIVMLFTGAASLRGGVSDEVTLTAYVAATLMTRNAFCEVIVLQLRQNILCVIFFQMKM